MCQLHFCLLLTAYITSNDDDDYVGSTGDHGYGDGAYGDGAYYYDLWILRSLLHV
jgi:hypothetical protein